MKLMQEANQVSYIRNNLNSLNVEHNLECNELFSWN